MSGVMSAGPGQLLKAGKYGLSAVAGKGAAKAANPVTTLAK